MSVHDPGLTLRQIVELADEIAALVAGRTREELTANREFRRALERCVELVGEAATRLPADWRESHPHVPWRQIIAMRNVLIHRYDVVLQKSYGTSQRAMFRNCAERSTRFWKPATQLRDIQPNESHGIQTTRRLGPEGARP